MGYCWNIEMESLKETNQNYYDLRSNQISMPKFSTSLNVLELFLSAEQPYVRVHGTFVTPIHFYRSSIFLFFLLPALTFDICGPKGFFRLALIYEAPL